MTSCLLSPQSRRSVELSGDTSKGYSERLVRDVMSIDVHVGAVWHEKLELTRGNVVSLKISGNLRQIVYVA